MASCLTYVPAPLSWIDPLGFACVQTGDKTPRGRVYTKHGADRTNERKFTSEIIDNIIDNNRKNRVREINPEIGTVQYRYQDKRGNTVITDEFTTRIITLYSYPESKNKSEYIPLKSRKLRR